MVFHLFEMSSTLFPPGWDHCGLLPLFSYKVVWLHLGSWRGLCVLQGGKLYKDAGSFRSKVYGCCIWANISSKLALKMSFWSKAVTMTMVWWFKLNQGDRTINTQQKLLPTLTNGLIFKNLIFHLFFLIRIWLWANLANWFQSNFWIFY